MARNVWILGAGFSRSLGGPLLGDLFSGRMEAELDVRYNLRTSAKESPTRWITFYLYHWGAKYRWWPDAEDYLARLDIATSDGHDSDAGRFFLHIIKLICDPSNWPNDQPNDPATSTEFAAVKEFVDSHHSTIVRDVCLESKRWMAAECCSFLKGVDASTERWRPYRDWAGTLTCDDAIITLNYDRVLETLVAMGNNRLDIVLPGKEVAPDKTAVLKLHGSVDWRVDEDGDFARADSHDFAALEATLENIGIAQPGYSKTNTIGRLQFLWHAAERALRSARTVVFLGYRFPETDVESRGRLLLSLRESEVRGDGNTGGPNCETVLGPDVSSRDSTRLRGLLLGSGAVTREENIRQQPLYAEDYLTIVSIRRKVATV